MRKILEGFRSSAHMTEVSDFLKRQGIETTIPIGGLVVFPKNDADMQKINEVMSKQDLDCCERLTYRQQQDLANLKKLKKK